MKKNIYWFFLLISAFGFSQVTKSAITGTVKSSTGEMLVAAVVETVQEPVSIPAIIAEETGKKKVATKKK